jgi:hypothetical protein
MRTLPLPAINPADLLAACVGGVGDGLAAARLNSATPTLLATSVLFHARAAAHTLDTIPRVATAGAGGATKADLEGLYRDQMSKARGAARRYYDLIRNGTEHGKCPLCGVGMVRTLDHHLPKSQYPDLSVCPYNLVPACDFCQAGKLARFPANPGEQTLHPYYDDYGAHQWIFATLDVAGPPALVFRADPPPGWAPVDQQRVTRHFSLFRLGHVYTSNANDDLGPLRSRLEQLDAAGGAATIQAYLVDERDRWANRLNSWQHIAYQTLAADAGFVNGGYLNIPV